jgi:hypothetical protein
MKPMRLTFKLFFQKNDSESFVEIKSTSVELALRQFYKEQPGLRVVRVERYFGPRKLS